MIKLWLVSLLYILVLCKVSKTYAQSEATTAEAPTEMPAQTTAAVAKDVKLDKSILLDEQVEQMNSLFKDMIVVQRKAIVRTGRFLADANFSLDFSDDPYTMYGLGLGAGYAFSESWEAHFVVTPVYHINERPIVKAVQRLKLQGGLQADLLSPVAKLGLEGHLIWVLAYGKDAWGPYAIVRSDTFLKILAGMIFYHGEKSGPKFGAMLGKTFFVSRNFNFRVAVGLASVTTFVNDISQSSLVGLVEPGLYWYF